MEDGCLESCAIKPCLSLPAVLKEKYIIPAGVCHLWPPRGKLDEVPVL